MTHGSLFSGIGGFDLAAEWCGWENVFHCEWNEFGQKVLKHYWPNATSYHDITKTDFTIHRGKIDILTGGFPCQPYSTAGKRKGTEDNRHLWPEMLRAIREIQPGYVVGENVRGLTNWNGGLVFDQVQADLEVEGYEVLPFLLPACAVNAPHRRDRIWFIAHSNGAKQRNNIRENTGAPKEIRGENKGDVFGEFPCYGDDTNANSFRLQRGSVRQKSEEIEKPVNKQPKGFDKLHGQDWQNFPTQSPICGGNDGISNELDGITFSKWRNESIKAYGNAIVPQVAFEIFKAINKYEETQNL